MLDREPDRPEGPSTELRAPAEAAFRAALEGADAYRAVRVALRLQEGVLRIGNRFVTADRFREIAFVALGNAAGSMALAAQQMLGERLTQGLLAGAVPAPAPVQFGQRIVSDPWPGSLEGEQALAEVRELVEGLGSQDLLLLLLSPGALAVTAGAPASMDRSTWQRFLRGLPAAGFRGAEVARVARGFGTGGVGGALGAAAGEATTVTLVVESGGPPELVGGGPTVVVGTGEKEQLRSQISPARYESGGINAPALSETVPQRLGPNVHRPVVVAGPADAIESAGNLLAGQGWISRLTALHLEGRLPEVVGSFLGRTDRIRDDRIEPPGGRALGPDAAQMDEMMKAALNPADPNFLHPEQAITARPGSRGYASFAGTTLDSVEGGEDEALVRRFLALAATQLRRRETAVAVLRTSGAVPGRGEAAGLLLTPVESGSTATDRQTLALPGRPGITDVGCVLLALVPWTDESEPKRRTRR